LIEQAFLDPAVTALIRAGSRKPFSNVYYSDYRRVSEILAGDEPMAKCKMIDERAVLA
jgi:hypothetical protein